MDQLAALLTDLQLNDAKNTLRTILTGNAVDFEQMNKKCSNLQQVYWKEYQYEFQFDIKPNPSDSAFNGNIKMTVIGHDNTELVTKHQLDSTKGRKNIKFSLTFDDIEQLNKVGILTKVYLESNTKDPWQCDWIKISVQQSAKRVKKKKNKPKVQAVYEAKMTKWINNKTPRFLMLTKK